MQAGIVVVLLLLLLLLLVLAGQSMFSTRIASLRFQVEHLERRHSELSTSVIKVHRWAEEQLHAVRGELTATRVVEQRVQKRLAAPAPEPEPELALALAEEPEPAPERDTIAMPAPKPSDEEGEATTFFKQDPPVYAPRSALMRPPAPLSPPDGMGGEDLADEPGYAHLGPEEKTPPRHGRAAMLLAEYSASEEGDAA